MNNYDKWEEVKRILKTRTAEVIYKTFIEPLQFYGEDDYLDAIDVITNCTKEFYNNSYPIIGIENDNIGGDIKLGLYLEHLLQAKLTPRIGS